MEERRKEKRFQQENRVCIQTGPESCESEADGAFDSLTHDICLSGARITTGRLYPVGTILRVQIDLTRSQRTFALDAEVRWGRPLEDTDLFEMGVEFQHEIPKTVLFLISHLYGEQQGVPTSVSMSK
ncbi:MAG: hypothetical protein GQ544_02400 [Candidatus Aminicenantes bacterium]|nr:hypothetical protein [Candidatus Aminicenantes bacterium]